MHPISVRARQATRFIEKAQHKNASNGHAQTDDLSTLKPGLWIQKADERDDQLVWEPSREDPDTSDSKSFEEDLPKYVLATLQCASYFTKAWQLDSQTSVLALCAEPPEDRDEHFIEPPDGDSGGGGGGEGKIDESNVAKYGDRARGFTLRYWADIFEIQYKEFISQEPPNPKQKQTSDQAGNKTSLVAHTQGIPGVPIHVAPRIDDHHHHHPPNASIIPTAHKPSAPAPARTALTKEALERNQSLFDALAEQDDQRRREACDLQRVTNEDKRKLGHGGGLINIPAHSFARPSPPTMQHPSPALAPERAGGRRAVVTGSNHHPHHSSPAISAASGRAPIRLDKDGVKLLRPEAVPTSYVEAPKRDSLEHDQHHQHHHHPSPGGRGSGKGRRGGRHSGGGRHQGNHPGRGAGRPNGETLADGPAQPKFTLLQRPKQATTAHAAATG